MVKLTENDKTLVVPAGLGNFGQGSGSGGSGMTPQEVQDMIDTSIEENNIELDVEFEDLSERISGNTEDIATISGTTGALGEMVASLSGTTSALTASVDSLAGAVTGLTEGFENLSGATAGISGNLNALSGSVETLSQSLSGYTTTDTFNQAISGLTGDLSGVTETLSQQISGVSADVEELSGVTANIESGLNGLSGATEAIEQAVGNKQDALTAGDGIDISGATISVKVGEGLAFSGGTIIVSGGTGNETPYYIINDILDSGASVAQAFYNEMVPLFSGSTSETLKNSNIYYRYAIQDATWNLATLVNGWLWTQENGAILTLVFDKYNYMWDFGNKIPGVIRVNIKPDGDNWVEDADGATPVRELFGKNVTLTSAGTVVDFNSYYFNMAFDEARVPGSYESPAQNPIRIVDANNTDNVLSTGNVISGFKVPSGSHSYGDYEVFRVVIEFFLNNTLYRMIGDSVSEGEYAGWHLLEITTVYTYNP